MKHCIPEGLRKIYLNSMYLRDTIKEGNMHPAGLSKIYFDPIGFGDTIKQENVIA